MSRHDTQQAATGSSVYTNSDLDALSSETIMVTPEMATTLRSDCHFERQRPISPANVHRLALEMKRGWFIPGTPVYLCTLPDGKMQIVNGNHTLEAIRESGVSVPLTFVYARVDDIEAAARVYANLDLQKVRTWQNSLQAVRGDATWFDGKVVSAVGIIMAGLAGTTKSRDDGGMATSRTARFEMFDEYKSAGHILHEAMLGGDRRIYRLATNAAALAVALITAKYQPSASAEFWGAVVKDDGLVVGDPRKTLIRYLQENAGGSGSASRLNTIKAAASAWNAAWQNRDASFFKPALVTEIKILGTAWHNGDPRKSPEMKRPKFQTGVIHNSNGSVQTVARFAG